MTECLRCGPEIVDVANWLIQQEADREPKELRSVTAWGAEVNLLRFGDQDREADGVARIVDYEVQHGTPEEEILVLLRSDGRGQVSKLLDEHLAGHGHLVYLPRRTADPDPDVQTLLEYLILCDSIGGRDHIDDLAVRSLIELEDRVGDRRRMAVVEFCVERGVRFYPAVCYLADHSEEYSSTGIGRVKEHCDAVIDRATGLARLPDEDFTNWLARVCDVVGLAGEALDVVRRVGDQILAEIEGALDDEALDESNFVQELLAGMANLGDTLPPRVPGNVTIMTMHGAKGLSADVVIVLQVEDELIPGEVLEQRDEDEARRLLYVSLTRARNPGRVPKLSLDLVNKRTVP
jgi:superfamily I DNA/RNA helicase